MTDWGRQRKHREKNMDTEHRDKTGTNDREGKRHDRQGTKHREQKKGSGTIS